MKCPHKHVNSENGNKLVISKKKHVINFKTEKEPKMKFFDFGAFKKMHMPLSEKYIHMLFGSFHKL